VTIFKHLITSFWLGEAGAKSALRLAIPLILSSSSFTLMQFADRKFLLIYSRDTFTAAAPAGMISFAFLSIFFGAANYINVFVAQYAGANLKEFVGKSLWQGIYFSFISWLLLLPLVFLAPFIFQFGGHELMVQRYETIYFQIMIFTSIFVLLNAVLSSFFSGKGETFIIMWVRILAVIINIPLDYILVFGKFGMPEMGIEGAAYATLISTALNTIMFCFLIFNKKTDQIYATLAGYRFDKKIFLRLLKFGMPNGLQFSISISSFAFFLLMIGRLGSDELAASNAAWSLNLLAFLPMVGFAIAVSTVVGREIGRKRIEVAKLAISNIFFMVLCYMVIVSSFFFFFPEKLLWLLFSGAPGSNTESIMEMSIIILRFIGIYFIFDSVNIVYGSAIKASGDTRFVMWISFFISLLVLVIPGYVFTTIIPLSVIHLWCFATLYICIVSVIFYLRYRTGIWEKMNIMGR